MFRLSVRQMTTNDGEELYQTRQTSPEIHGAQEQHRQTAVFVDQHLYAQHTYQQVRFIHGTL